MELIYKIIGIAVCIIAITAILLPITNELHSDEVSTIDIILIDGQSNGAYTGITSRCDPEIVNQNLGEPEHKAYFYGTPHYSSRVVNSDTKIREMYRDGEWAIGGEEPGLAYYLMQKNHRDVLVLNIAKGATGIQELATGETWTNGKAVIDAALAEIDQMYEAKNFVGWVLIHGEADRNNTVSYYEQYFNILDKNLAKSGFKECYIALPRFVYGLNAYNAMLDLANTNPTVHIATKITDTFTVQNGLLNTDNLHYTQLGRLVLAEAVIDSIPANPNYDSDISGLIQAIPVIVIIGVILMAVRLFHNKTE